MREIVAAALRDGDLIFTMARPARHGDITRNVMRGGFDCMSIPEEGFLTSEGQFVDRYYAYDIALAARQCKPKPEGMQRLISQDVW